METFICMNDDFEIGIFIESRDDDKFDKKIYLDFGKFDRIKSVKKYIRIYSHNSCTRSVSSIRSNI